MVSLEICRCVVASTWTTQLLSSKYPFVPWQLELISFASLLDICLEKIVTCTIYVFRLETQVESNLCRHQKNVHLCIYVFVHLCFQARPIYKNRYIGQLARGPLDLCSDQRHLSIFYTPSGNRGLSTDTTSVYLSVRFSFLPKLFL